ncbi:hypothetical protein H0H92_000189 [Tricholoma furcatifolium]|nr:hypothetical protein H0H92_000189 [Tricholoma furcatifolium]
MTSRVQKGGPIFRPVAKSRPRPEISQSSQNSSATQPPPSSPLLSTSFTASNEHPSSEAVAIAFLPSAPVPASAIPVARIPPPITSTPPPILSARSTPAPPTLVTTHSKPIKRPPVASSSLAPSSSSQTQKPQNPEPSSNPQPLPSSSAETLLPLTLNTEPSVKLPRTRKKTTSSTDPSSNLPTEEIVDGSAPASKPRKNSRASSTAQKTPAKRKKTSSSSDAEDETTESTSKRKRRASSTPRSRRSRAPSLPPYDPDADPGEDIDPTVVTMASLCSDTGQGRVSRKAAEILSNHAAWKVQNREKRARMKALMELKKYGREEEAEALETANAPAGDKTVEENQPAPSPSSKTPAITDDTGGGFDYTQDLTTSRFNVQVRIGPNGETIIDEESLVVDRVEAEDTSNYTHVIESDHTKFVNSGSYGKRYRGSRWSAEETELFFDALAQYGENYELIAYVLPGRDRKSCKNKFKAEDKKNPARINHCLNNSRPVGETEVRLFIRDYTDISCEDMETLSRMTGKDFSGPVPEIRVLTQQPLVKPVDVVPSEQVTASHETVKRKPRKKMSQEDGVMIRLPGTSIARTVAASAFGYDIPQIQLSSRRPDKIYNILKNSIPKDRLLPPVPLNVTKPETLLPAFRDADVIVSLVGVLNGPLNAFEEIQFRGAENVARATREVGAKLIHFSAIGANPQSPIPYQKTKGLAETSVLRICPDATIIRPSLVFGPDDVFFNVGTTYRRFSRLSKFLPFMPVFGGGTSRFQPVYVGDLARAVEIIARDDPAMQKLVAGTIIEAGGPEIFTFRQIMELVLKYNNRYRPIIPLPFWVGLLEGAIFEKLPENLFTLTRDQVSHCQLVQNTMSSATESKRDTDTNAPAPDASERPFSIYTSREKWFIVSVIAFAALFSPFTANIYFPAIPSISKAFNKSTELINLTAAGSASTVAIGAGAIGDISTPKERGGFFGMFSIGPMVGPSIGPVIGGVLAQHLGWRSIFWFICIASSACLVVLVLFLPETLRSLVGDGSVPPPAINRPIIPIIKTRGEPHFESRPQRKTLQNPLRLMIHLDIIVLLVLTAVACAVYYGFTATVSTLFATTYPYLSETEIGLCFLAIGGGMLFGGICAGKILDWEYRRIFKNVTGTGKETTAISPKDMLAKQTVAENFPIEEVSFTHGKMLEI